MRYGSFWKFPFLEKGKRRHKGDVRPWQLIDVTREDRLKAGHLACKSAAS
jgi:hypothetical protein